MLLCGLKAFAPGNAYISYNIILQRIEPLLNNDREIIKYNRTISRQRLGKHVPAEMDTQATIEVLLCPCKMVISRTTEARMVQFQGSRRSERTWSQKQRNNHC
jgi:hypothetical protein